MEVSVLCVCECEKGKGNLTVLALLFGISIPSQYHEMMSMSIPCPSPVTYLNVVCFTEV
jgi:hypothetical protein